MRGGARQQYVPPKSYEQRTGLLSWRSRGVQEGQVVMHHPGVRISIIHQKTLKNWERRKRRRKRLRAQALPKEKPSPAKSTVKKLFHEGKEEDTSGSEKVGKVNDAEQRPMLIDDTQVPKEKHGKKLMEEKVGEKEGRWVF